MNSCLNCKWFSEIESEHKWHTCMFPIIVPHSVHETHSLPIDRNKPYRDCPCFERL